MDQPGTFQLIPNLIALRGFRLPAFTHALAMFMLAAALLMLSPRMACAQASGNFSDSGTFEIRSVGQLVGTEKFRIARNGAWWESHAELSLMAGDATLEEKATLRLAATMRPDDYLREQKSPLVASLAVRFGEKETSLVATSGKESAERVFFLNPGFLIILDTNFFHHYTFLLRQYTRSQGGEQLFNVFIPQEALPGTVNLVFVGKTNDEERWKVTTDELEMEIVARENGAIQKISIPEAGVEITRK